jgi:hypothetical protein
MTVEQGTGLAEQLEQGVAIEITHHVGVTAARRAPSGRGSKAKPR